MTAFVANTNLLELIGLQNATDGSFIDGATVTATIVDASGAELSGQSWPLALAYIASSSGNYRLALPDSLPLIAGRKYIAHVHADDGNGSVGDWSLPFWPQVRKS
jgi:hypothetical protein